MIIIENEGRRAAKTEMKTQPRGRVDILALGLVIKEGDFQKRQKS